MEKGPGIRTPLDPTKSRQLSGVGTPKINGAVYAGCYIARRLRQWFFLGKPPVASALTGIIFYAMNHPPSKPFCKIRAAFGDGAKGPFSGAYNSYKGMEN
jgi:hypothetical protein